MHPGLSKQEEGMTLLMTIFMLSLLISTIMTCTFVLKAEVNNDMRHTITSQRLTKVKQALIGRLAYTRTGTDATACGGLISDFGSPVNPGSFTISVLLDDPDNSEWPDWKYGSSTNFWAGYRGERYLNPVTGSANFFDGWGFPVEVTFSGDKTSIISYGSDGQKDTGTETGYERDIVYDLIWQRDVSVMNNTGDEVNFRLIYPASGTVTYQDSETITPGSLAAFVDISIGLRKIEVQDSVDGSVRDIKMCCVPPGAGVYLIIVD